MKQKLKWFKKLWWNNNSSQELGRHKNFLNKKNLVNVKLGLSHGEGKGTAAPHKFLLHWESLKIFTTERCIFLKLKKKNVSRFNTVKMSSRSKSFSGKISLKFSQNVGRFFSLDMSLNCTRNFKKNYKFYLKFTRNFLTLSLVFFS